MKPNSSIVQRLAFAKYLYGLAVEQSQQAEPLSSASILYFHDSVELYLQIASEHLNVGDKCPLIMNYFDLLNPKVLEGKELSQKEAVRRLDKARVALKHHGTLPSKLDIESFRVSVRSFFLENTPLLFDLEFAEITLVEFVNPEEVRENLQEVEKLRETRDYPEALKLVALSFRVLLDDYKDRKITYGISPLDIGIRHPFSPFSKLQAHRGQTSLLPSQLKPIEEEFAQVKREAEKAFDEIEESIEILALGVDFKRYSRFKLLTPNLVRGINKDYIFIANRLEKPSIEQEDIDFCINFVVETSLVLQEFDYDVPKPIKYVNIS